MSSAQTRSEGDIGDPQTPDLPSEEAKLSAEARTELKEDDHPKPGETEKAPLDPLQVELESRLAHAIERAYAKNKRFRQQAGQSKTDKSDVLSRLSQGLGGGQQSASQSLNFDTRNNGALLAQDESPQDDEEVGRRPDEIAVRIDPTLELDECGEGAVQGEIKGSTFSPKHIWTYFKNRASGEDAESRSVDDDTTDDQREIIVTRPFPDNERRSFPDRVTSAGTMMRSAILKKYTSLRSGDEKAGGRPKKTHTQVEVSEDGGFEGPYESSFYEKVSSLDIK